MRAVLVTATLLFGAIAFAKEKKAEVDPVAAVVAASEIELYSLDPSFGGRQEEGFHGWKILGKTTIKDAEPRKALAAAFKKGVEDNEGVVAGCFIPRHGIRVKYDGKTVDLVICFQCYSFQHFVDDKQGKGGPMTPSPQPLFNKVLTDAKVPLPKPADK
jgi:hypothetical protein